MSKTVAVIEGEDSSPEAMRPVVELLSDLLPEIRWVYPKVGESAIDEFSTSFPREARQAIDQADTTLFGSTSGPSGAALRYLRWGKDTYANVRPCRYLPGCFSPLRYPDGIDFVIVRENLEDLYVGIEGDLQELKFLEKEARSSGQHISHYVNGRYALKIITQEGTQRIVRFACELARKRESKRKVTCVTKHNMLHRTDGYFLKIAEAMVEEYSDLSFESYIVDDFACRLIREPQEFDVVVTPNLYGDILSDAAGGLLGSLGMSASGCYGDKYAYFEPAHGTAPDIAGTNTINPTATLLSATMMLDYLKYESTAKNLQRAIETVYGKGISLTPDQNGTATSSQFVEAVRECL
ncbi:MAG: isocitrate/isopropylmalate family dehydrogenase [Gammaproteobacteria bacterium]|nr:isocitrate/isopropylmalate family dehydrogenase [Gammaproteobacteria bacterium]